MLETTSQISLIKKLTTALYGYDNLEVETIYHAVDQNHIKLSGTYLAIVTRKDNEIQNQHARDVESGWGYNEEQAVSNLFKRLKKTLQNEINSYSLEINKTNKKLQEFLELQKETREIL